MRFLLWLALVILTLLLLLLCQVMDLLLAAGAQVDQCNGEGRSALHRACNYGQLEAAERLLCAGALDVAFRALWRLFCVISLYRERG